MKTRFIYFYYEYIKPFIKTLPLYIFLFFILILSEYYFSYPVALTQFNLVVQAVLFLSRRFFFFVAKKWYTSMLDKLYHTYFYAKISVHYSNFKERIFGVTRKKIEKPKCYLYWSFKIEKLSDGHKDQYSLYLIKEYNDLIKEIDLIYKELSGKDIDNDNNELMGNFLEKLSKLNDINKKFKKHIK